MIKRPEQVYGNAGRQLYYQWTQSEHLIHHEPVYDHTREYIESLEAENAKLRELVQYTCDECYGDDWFVEKAAALGIEGQY